MKIQLQKNKQHTSDGMRLTDERKHVVRVFSTLLLCGVHQPVVHFKSLFPVESHTLRHLLCQLTVQLVARQAPGSASLAPLGNKFQILAFQAIE
jgi:hypothetical protein